MTGERPRLRTLRGLDIPTSELKGIGPQKRAAFAQMGIDTVLDLLMHYPHRYVDRTHRAEIAGAVEGEEAMFVGALASVTTRRPQRGRTMVEAVLDDGTGTLLCTFFNQGWRANQLHRGLEVAAFGTVAVYRGRLQLVNPALDLIGEGGEGSERRTGKVVPIYPQSAKAGIGSAEISRHLEEVLARAGEFADPLPAPHREELRLRNRTRAFHDVHEPPEYDDAFPARRRLAFDELFRLQLELVMRKRAAELAARGIAHDVTAEPGLVSVFLGSLPFAPTGAQARAIAEIARDLGGRYPMHRLLQGDVGAGKTVVALATLLYGVQSGCQGALMVPTEVLAEQHFLAAGRLLAGLEVPDERRLGGRRPLGFALLTARTPAGERARLRTELLDGATDLVVGTHALLTDDVRFRRLGVVVIDEQHRFGVEQRAALKEKADGHDPDVLVMTATPIPRTAAMTVYGDLDLTVLDELPAGRTPVRTTWCRSEDEAARAWKRIRAEVEAGRQAYVVCPLVAGGDDAEADDGAADEESPDGGAEGERPPPRSAEDEHRRLGGPGGELEGMRLGLLHGQLPPRRKEEVMAAFRSGELDVLVATTVIEVGVDVTRATVMVVEDADRFGLAQLHQLRGRVGRGADQSWCYLLATDPTPDGAQRLEAMELTTDGFELAEVDLELRGEGTVLGTRQQGRNELRLASIRRDRDLVLAARKVAEQIVDEDPELDGHPVLADELRLFISDEAAAFLFKS